MINRVAHGGDDQLDLLLMQESDNILTPVSFIYMYSLNLRRELLGNFEQDPPKYMSILRPIFCSNLSYNCSGVNEDRKMDFLEKHRSL